MRGLRFEWNPKKAAANLRKHHVSFRDGLTLFLDRDELMWSDPDHCFEEKREVITLRDEDDFTNATRRHHAARYAEVHGLLLVGSGAWR